jgi:hypothetical protein
MWKIIVSIAAICQLAMPDASAQSVNLQMQADYSVGNVTFSPRYAVGDVNNDGFADLVTLNKSNATDIGPISVFLNTTTGGFGAPINIQVASLSPNAVVIGDYNEDGNADLAIAQDGIANGIQIRLGNGTGNFPTGTFIAAERGSPAIASADFNGDANLDIAICTNVNELRVLSGTGSGTFSAAAVFPTANTCQDMRADDFNVDGRADIVVAQRTAATSIQVFLSNGPSFNSPVNTVASGAFSLVVADFNRDCVPDLAAVQYSGSLVYIMLGNRSGGFTVTTTTVTNSPAHMAVGDFNRDKKVDLAIRRNTTVAGSMNLTILPGDGSGGFGTPFEQSIAVPGTTTEMRLATIDANRDGKADLIVGRNGGFILYHGNSPRFTSTETDFDGDLSSDLSVFRPSNGTWYVNRSTYGPTAVQWGLAGDSLTPADYDGDGLTDVAVWRANGFGDPARSYFFILRSSDGTLQQEQFGRSGDNPAIAGDWDGDGRADVAVYRNGAAAGDPSYIFYRPSASPATNFQAVQYGLSGDEAVRGDFDGDHKLDLAVFRPSNSVWYISQSSNSQLVYQNWGTSSDRRVVGDYDGDGKSDVAVFRPSDNTWYILNSSNGTASYRQWGINGDIIAPGDFNGDGKTEPTVYRPSDQRWYTPPCMSFVQNGVRFGASGDTAVPSAFVQ